MESLLDSSAAKTALLSLITSTPERAGSTFEARNNIQTDARTNRQLSLDHERSVTQQLAFMSAYSVDPHHVTAICVEEVTEERIIFRFSANGGVHDWLSKGLASIARILEDEACNINRAQNSQTLLNAAISLNRRRILCRLRSRHARFSQKTKKYKPSLLRRLRTAQNLLSRSSSASSFQALSREIADIQRHFNQLEEMDADDVLSPRSDDCLLSLVKGINNLLKFEQTLRNIPHKPGEWDTNATGALIDCVQKSGHYVDACKELLKAARRYPGFSNIDIEYVNLQFSSAPVSDADAAVDKGVTTELFNRVSDRLGRRVKYIKEDVKLKLKEKSRLHAEIQLVLFYEQQNRPCQPRIICASKRACYLCHLLLETQGKYVIPSTHGRLYTGWKYPMQGLQGLLPEFAARIELALLENVNQKAARRPNPVESAVHLLPAITPSNRSDITAVTRMSSQTEAISIEGTNATGRGSMRTHTASIGASLTENGTAKAELATEMANLQPRGEHDTENTIRSRRDHTPEIHLTRGTTAVHLFTKDKRTLHVLAADLHLHWECDNSTFEGGKSTTVSRTKNEFQISLTWLDSQAHFEYSDLQAIDLAGNWGQKPVADSTLFTSGGLVLQRDSTLLRFQALPT